MENVLTAETIPNQMNGGLTKAIWLEDQVMKFEKSRFGWMAVMIAFQSCLGSVAAGLAYNSGAIIALGICTVFTMTNNALLLAQCPASWCVRAFYIGVVANILAILMSII